MQQTEPRVTTQRGYLLPDRRDAGRREGDTAARTNPYERSYELRRGYERPVNLSPPYLESMQERPC